MTASPKGALTDHRGRKIACTARWTDTPQAKDLKHLALHVAKKAGKICALAEDLDHAPVSKERWDKLMHDDIPDLVIIAAMLAEKMGIDLSGAVEDRGRRLVSR